jgi:hypothetical protein
MRDTRGRIAALLFLAVWGMAASVPAAERLALHYDVYYLAFRIVSVDVASNVEAEAYSATVALRTAGLFATFVPWQSNIIVSGRIDGSTLRPESYRASNAYRSRRQRIDLDYGSGDAVRGDVQGMLTDDERDEVPDALRLGTVDPVTAGALVARRLAATGTCAGTVPVFDGLRRYDLRYEDLGVAELERSSRDSYRGSARLCRATVDAIAGFLRSGEHANEHATELSAWLAPPVPGASPEAVRLELSGPRGTLRVHLARATPGVS